MGRHIGHIAPDAVRPTSLWTPWGEQAVPVAGAKFAALRKLAKRIGHLKTPKTKPLGDHRNFAGD
ncbi:hypothetical protein [Mesorhizobium sp. A556]